MATTEANPVVEETAGNSLEEIQKAVNEQLATCDSKYNISVKLTKKEKEKAAATEEKSAEAGEGTEGTTGGKRNKRKTRSKRSARKSHKSRRVFGGKRK